MRTRPIGTAVLPALAASALATLALAATAAAQAPEPYGVLLHAGDVMVPMRDGRAPRHRRLPAGPRGRPGRDPAPGPPAAHPLRQGGARARRARGLLRPARLRSRAPGHAGPLRVRGHVLQVPRLRRDGRLRHRRVDSRPALHGRRRGHVRYLLRGPHPGRRGQDGPAAPRAPAPQPGRHLRPLAAQGAQPRARSSSDSSSAGPSTSSACRQTRSCGPPSRPSAWPTGSRRSPSGAASARWRRRPSSRTTCSSSSPAPTTTRPDADVRHWTRLGVNWSAYYGRTADVPMLHVAGWYDPYVGSMFENFLG